MNGSDIWFAVSNDGGKTGIYWRQSAQECLDYLEPHKDVMSDYCVVAVRKRASEVAITPNTQGVMFAPSGIGKG